jgi:hypothetical protein
MFYLCTEFDMPSCSGPLVTAVILKLKETAEPLLLFVYFPRSICAYNFSI